MQRFLIRILRFNLNKAFVLIVVLGGGDSSNIFSQTDRISSFFKSKTTIASKYDKYLNHAVETFSYTEYELDVYWQVTRSDSKSSSLAQTETHRQVWKIREEHEAPFFYLISDRKKVPLLSSSSDYLRFDMLDFYFLSLKELDLAKLLGLDETQLDLEEGLKPQTSVSYLYIGEKINKENIFVFKMASEDYYEARMEIKMKDGH